MKPYYNMNLEERVLLALALEMNVVRRHFRDFADYNPDRTGLPKLENSDALPEPDCWAICLLSDEAIALAKKNGWVIGSPVRPFYGPYFAYKPWMLLEWGGLTVEDVPPIWERVELACKEEERLLDSQTKIPMDIEEAKYIGWPVCPDTNTVSIISQRAFTMFVTSGRWQCYLDEKSGMYIASPIIKEVSN